MTRLIAILLAATLLCGGMVRAQVLTFEATFGTSDVPTVGMVITTTNLVTWTVLESKGIDAGIAPTMKWTVTNSEPVRFYRVIQTDKL